MFQRLKDFLNKISPTKAIDRASESLAADKKRTAKRNRTGKIDSSQGKIVQQIDKVSLFFGNDKRDRAKEKEAKNIARQFEKNLGMRDNSRISRAIDNYTNFMVESRKEQSAKITDLKKRNSFIKSEREAYIERENKRIEKIFNNLQFDSLHSESEEARRAKLSELEWAIKLDSGDFDRNIIPESVLERLEQKNENWSGSEMVTVKREILLKAVKEDVKQQDPFRANREALSKKEPTRQYAEPKIENIDIDDDFDIDNIPF